MKTMTPRLDQALTRLYNAFHGGTLRHGDCTACAVGNMVDVSDGYSGFEWYYEDEDLKEYYKQIESTGYSANEVKEIERRFESIDYGSSHKERQFKGLCAVVEYLCELDGIPNVMDYTKLFETTEDNKPKYELVKL